MTPDKIYPYWVKDRFSQNCYCPYDPKEGPIYGMSQTTKPKSNIIGEYVLYDNRTEVFLDKTHELYTELINARKDQ